MGISVQNVSKRFGDFVALDDVSIDVEAGSLTALLGPSGSGKSTLLRVIAGLETPDSGLVRIGSDDVTGHAPQDRGVGFVFQHYAAFKHMTVHDNVAFGLKIRKRPRADIEARVHELLELVQLQGLAKRYPSQLSGGQRQRMGLARALAVDPPILLMDEPFGALDPLTRRRLQEEFRALQARLAKTVVLVTHDVGEACYLADRIAVLDAGRLVQIGTPEQLRAAPASDFVAAFLHRQPGAT